MPWKWKSLSLRENDITDFAVDDICGIMTQLGCLERIDIDGNLIYRRRNLY